METHTEFFTDQESQRSRIYQAMYNKYFDRMVALVRANIRGQFSGKIEPSDVASTAFYNVLRRIGVEEIGCRNRARLWKFLKTATLNELRTQIRYHLAQRRDLTREVELETLRTPPRRDCTAEDMAMLSEEVEAVLERFKPGQREIAERILAGEKNVAIASETQRSKSTVNRIGSMLEKALIQRFSMN